MMRRALLLSGRPITGAGRVGGMRSGFAAPATVSIVSCFWSPLLVARRFQGHGRPTFAEIAGALNALGATVDQDPKALRKSYLDLVRKHHPDTGGDMEKMKSLTTSYNLLTSLSNSERSSYKTQAAAMGGRPRGGFSGSSNASAAGSSGGPGGVGANPNSQYAYDFQRMYEQQQRSRDFHYRYSRQQSSAEQPFRPVNPFSNPFGQARMNVLRMNTRTIFFRMFAAYLVLTAVSTFSYRRYRDYLHDDGWRASESLSRQEKIEEMYRLRQELMDRVAPGNPAVRKAVQDSSSERRAMEYAERRQREMAVLQRTGFVNFAPQMGSLFKEADEPEGTIHFEPRAGVPMPAEYQRFHGQQPPPPLSPPQQQQPQQQPQRPLPRSREEAMALAEDARRWGGAPPASLPPPPSQQPPVPWSPGPGEATVGSGERRRVPTEFFAAEAGAPGVGSAPAFPGASRADAGSVAIPAADASGTGRPRQVLF